MVAVVETTLSDAYGVAVFQLLPFTVFSSGEAPKSDRLDRVQSPSASPQ
jgi:hypothetical protein